MNFPIKLGIVMLTINLVFLVFLVLQILKVL